MALFLTTDELKNYVPVDANINFTKTLLPFVKEAEQLYIIDLLGQDMYDTLEAAYTTGAGVITDPDLAALLPYVQRPLAYYTMYQAVAMILANVGDAGVLHSRGDNSEPAPKWKVDEMRFNYLAMGDMFAEKLLEFLEANASALKYADWFSSSANTRDTGLMVPSTRIASLYIDINESRRIFKRMLKRIKDIEGTVVKKLLCTDQYDDIVTQIKTDTVTAANQKLIDLLRPMISKMALHKTIPSLRLNITDQGLTMYSSSDGVVSKNAARMEDIRHLLFSLKDDEVTGYLADQQAYLQFINDNITDYPLIEASDCYTLKADPGPKYRVDNDPDNSYFSV